MDSYLTPKEEQYNQQLYVEIDSTCLGDLFPLELVRLVSTYGCIRPTEYHEPPGTDQHVSELSRFVHKCIYSTDDLPWIVLVHHPYYGSRVLFIFHAFVSCWDHDLLFNILQTYLDLNLLQAEITHKFVEM